jgi:hypothetical protein
VGGVSYGVGGRAVLGGKELDGIGWAPEGGANSHQSGCLLVDGTGLKGSARTTRQEYRAGGWLQWCVRAQIGHGL